MNSKHLFFSALFLISLSAFAQGGFNAGVLPSLNINKKINPRWKLNTTAASRFYFYQSDFDAEENPHFLYELADFSLLVNNRLSDDQSLSLGYLIRYQNSAFAHRIIQQYTLLSNYFAFRLSHRFSSDQTFQKEEAFQLRLRYRITSEFALMGQSVNEKEFYLKVGNEYLGIYQETLALEIRATPFLGYLFTDNNKIELGVDYRLREVISPSRSTRLWCSLNWYLSF
ncbi:MAG: DUF2490 domain-containing protein [Crocinitomicaceae bacterium]